MKNMLQLLTIAVFLVWVNCCQTVAVNAQDIDTPNAIIQLPKSGLVGHWKFDEGNCAIALDHSGRGDHGVILGAVLAEGKVCQGLRFDGYDDYVRETSKPWNSASLLIPMATMMAKVKPIWKNCCMWR